MQLTFLTRLEKTRRFFSSSDFTGIVKTMYGLFKGKTDDNIYDEKYYKIKMSRKIIKFACLLKTSVPNEWSQC